MPYFFAINMKGNIPEKSKEAKNALSGMADAADKAQQAVGNIDNGGEALSTIGNNAKEATLRLKGFATQVLALAGAYKALQGVGGYINRIFDFSSSLESSQVAIASVIGATNKIKDSQGRTLEGAEKFNAAQQISAKLMDEIQIRALETTATFDELVSGVSGIIAPATKAGVAIEKLPKFAVTAAQAMAAMKIPTQQMRTEIESLLSGNINKVQDILATNLGITGEMVKNWQKQGTLIEEIEKRLSIFAEAGEATAQSWAGLKNNLQDAYDYLSAKTGKGVFEGAKQSYREFLDLLVNTKGGKLGVGEDIENIVGLVEELQDEIGNQLVSVTREFVDYLRELNKPENIANLRRDFKDFANTIEGVWGHITSVGNAINGIVSTSLAGWQQMPDVVKELGIVGAIAFGAKGRAALVAVGASYAWLQRLFDLAASGDGGADAYAKHWAKKGENATNPPALIPSHGSAPSLAASHGKESQQYITSNDIGGFTTNEKGASKIASAREQLQKIREEIAALNGEATKSSNSLEQKEREIEKLGKAAGLSANDIDKLKTQYGEAFKTNTLQGFNKQIAQLEGNTKALRDIQLDEEVKKWSASFNELVSKGKMTTGEAAENIERLKTAISKQTDLKNLQTATSFYKELGELSGSYGLSIKYQNMLIREQRETWKTAGIPDELIDEWEKLKGLQVARDPFSGLTRGLRSYSNDATDFARNFETLTTTAFGNVEDAFTKMLTSGRLNFTDFANSIISDMARIAIRSNITGPLASGLGSLLNFGGGSSPITTPGFTNTDLSGSIWGLGGKKFAHGGVLSGAGISSYSNSLITSPTVFSYHGMDSPIDRAMRPFAKGAGLMGEAGWEAVMPLTRNSSGDLAVHAVGLGSQIARDVSAAVMARGGGGTSAAPQVTVNINNNTSAQITQQTRTDNRGNRSIEITVGDMAAGQAMKPGSSMNRALRAATGVQQPAIRR